MDGAASGALAAGTLAGWLSAPLSGGSFSSESFETSVGLAITGANPTTPGHNPTTSIYNAIVVKIYNATNSITRFLNKNYFSPM
jgi:hypothetical protein